MKCTEKEAATKWCNFVRLVVLVPDDVELSAHNRQTTIDAKAGEFIADVGPYCCIGSRCMHWEWDDLLDDEYSRSNHLAPAADARGYCGLSNRSRAVNLNINGVDADQ